MKYPKFIWAPVSTAVLIGWDPATPSLPPHLDSYTVQACLRFPGIFEAYCNTQLLPFLLLFRGIRKKCACEKFVLRKLPKFRKNTVYPFNKLRNISAERCISKKTKIRKENWDCKRMRQKRNKNVRKNCIDREREREISHPSLILSG